MPCVYRLEYVDPMGARADYKLLESYYPSGYRGGFDVVDWFRPAEEIPQSSPWPHCRVLRAPLFPDHLAQQIHVYKVSKDKSLPDIVCVASRLLVSQAAREVIKSLDDFEHEFTETEIQDKQRRRINEQPYFLLSIRRFLEIEGIDGPLMPTTNYRFNENVEGKMLRTLGNCPELMAEVAKVPFWRHPILPSYVYLSEEALGKLRAAGLTGLKDLSTSFGEPGEAVGRFCCA